LDGLDLPTCIFFVNCQGRLFELSFSISYEIIYTISHISPGGLLRPRILPDLVLQRENLETLPPSTTAHESRFAVSILAFAFV
jgi:hypothetical protein